MDFQYIHNQLEVKGYVEIENFLNLSQIKQIKKFINEKKNELNKSNFSLANKELDHPVFNEILCSKHIEELSDCLIGSISSKYKNLEKHVVLGVRSNFSKNKKKIKKNTAFHFDAYYLTINIPITMPENLTNEKREVKSGDLLIIPNFRKFSNSLIKNIIFKTLMQNTITRYLLGLNIFNKLLNIQRIKLSNSKIYLFYGFRTLHGVDTNYELGERTTFLIHLHNPHKGSFFDNYVKNKHKKQRLNSINK